MAAVSFISVINTEKCHCGYIYKTESFLRPAVTEASASKPARLTSKREARWIQDDIQKQVNQDFHPGPGSEGAGKEACPM